MASIANFFNSGVPYKKTNLIQKKFLKGSILHITKGYCPLSSIETISLKRFTFHLCIWVVFFNRGQFTSEVIPMMFNMTMEWYVILFPAETSQLLPLWIYGCLEEAWTLVHLLQNTSTKGGKHVISWFKFVRFMKHQTRPWLCNWKPCLLSMNYWTRS